MQWGTEINNPTYIVNRLMAAISGQPHLVASRDLSSTVTPVTIDDAVTLFDLPGISRKTLGKHWSRLNPSEQDEFIALFAQLLIHVAFPQSAAFFRGLEVTVTDERMRGHQATVMTYVEHATEGQIDIDYRLIRQDNAWLIRDIQLDGVSLSRNLRAQFRQIIRRGSYEELLRRMREKLEHAIAPSSS
ncbi:MlaC/ttg2D family ABC transporter substrate-binding protein [Candidatus Entotheonella palauensis]|uniref:MlaC/ttg2D family ABC transporter substrate-binding protein n=1 Tax=Candidatus Entotheonella palauensis TaxID=93172 RepID=UPI0015C4B897|nr:ABC transporter substrate-binding protein [Candidatus Entotheonella palauensis]